MKKSEVDEVRTMMKEICFMTLKYDRNTNKWLGNEQGKGWQSPNDDEEILVLWPWNITKKKTTNVFVMMKPEVDQVRKMMKKFWFFDLEI